MKIEEKYLNEKVDMKFKDKFWDAYQGLSDATKGLQIAYGFMFDDKMKKKIKNLYNEVAKTTMEFNNKYYEEAGAKKITGIRWL